jgi:tetratricopeptide (TPR) repeat protein
MTGRLKEIIIENINNFLMKKTILFAIISFALVSNIFSQDAKEYYDQGFEKAMAGKYEEAIKLFDKSIELNQTEYVSWFNRGISKSLLNDYEGALPDFDQTLKLYPDYKKGYLNRGNAKKHLTDYQGALDDYSAALKIDTEYSDAYYNRGLVYEMLDKRDSACFDFKKADKYGCEFTENKIEDCNDNEPRDENYFSILRLTKKAENDKYGFTKEDPIKVGVGPNGGPANQHAYLELLRDKQGKPVKYNRLGSCCLYKTPNGMFGYGMLDQYEITYRNEKNEVVKSVLFISFDDYEDLKIPYGFETVGKK